MIVLEFKLSWLPLSWLRLYLLWLSSLLLLASLLFSSTWWKVIQKLQKKPKEFMSLLDIGLLPFKTVSWVTLKILLRIIGYKTAKKPFLPKLSFISSTSCGSLTNSFWELFCSIFSSPLSPRFTKILWIRNTTSYTCKDNCSTVKVKGS